MSDDDRKADETSSSDTNSTSSSSSSDVEDASEIRVKDDAAANAADGIGVGLDSSPPPRIQVPGISSSSEEEIRVRSEISAKQQQNSRASGSRIGGSSGSGIGVSGSRIGGSSGSGIGVSGGVPPRIKPPGHVSSSGSFIRDSKSYKRKSTEILPPTYDQNRGILEKIRDKEYIVSRTPGTLPVVCSLCALLPWALLISGMIIGTNSTRGLVIFVLGVFGLFYFVIFFIVATILSLKLMKTRYTDLEAAGESQASWCCHNWRRRLFADRKLSKEQRKAKRDSEKDANVHQMQRLMESGGEDVNHITKMH